MSREPVQIGGRRLLVEFTCGRCGTKELVHYEHDSNYDVKCNVRSNTVPDGWRTASDGLPLLCADCNNKLLRFMEGLI